MIRKLALIIGNDVYQDPTLSRLVTPGEDVRALADVLRAHEIGAFDRVTTLVNAPAVEVRLEIESFFSEARPDDLLVLYFSGHGVRDDQGQLSLAVTDTRTNRLRATAIPAAYITDGMDRSRSRRQVLILDCCHSGAFAQGAKGVLGESVGTKGAFEGIGFGRVVLTATDATQYAWEGDDVIGHAEHSVFTRHVIEGLRTGAADANGDGHITLDELYEYVYAQVVLETPRQTPSKWSYRQQGDLILAHNSRPAPAELPVDLQPLLLSPVASVREAAVRELTSLLRAAHPGLAQAAREALTALTRDDSRRVAAAAAAALGSEAQDSATLSTTAGALPTPKAATQPQPPTVPEDGDRRTPEPIASLPSDPARSDSARTIPPTIVRRQLGWAVSGVAVAVIAVLAWWLISAQTLWVGAPQPGVDPTASATVPALSREPGPDPLPAPYAAIVAATVDGLAAVRAVPLSAQSNDEWWFYASSQPTMSEGRLTLAGTDDYYSAIVRQAALEDNTGLLLALTLSVAAPTSDPSWCEIGVSGEIDQVTAYLLLCENPFRAMAGEFRAGIFEDAIALSADPAPRFVRASDEAYGLFIARGRQNQVALVLWPLAAPEARTIFSIEDPPYAPNYVFAKPYPGVALTLRDVVAVKFEALK